jgi:cold shock CspA family protein
MNGEQQERKIFVVKQQKRDGNSSDEAMELIGDSFGTVLRYKISGGSGFIKAMGIKKDIFVSHRDIRNKVLESGVKILETDDKVKFKLYSKLHNGQIGYKALEVEVITEEEYEDLLNVHIQNEYKQNANGNLRY